SQPELNVWSNGGILYITSTTNKDINVFIYTIDGKLIEKTIVNGHKQIAGLPKGIYIVNRQKVVIQ
ncbi:MAG: T9SS type A sorting domain-containing protein, partial [Paraprevotella sp.]|nr:T9SS type A sorting domain-containing protein [Paraprevotella sp.]